MILIVSGSFEIKSLSKLSVIEDNIPSQPLLPVINSVFVKILSFTFN